MTPQPPSISKVVRQHAETSRLMGVDFVPVYRPGAGGANRDPVSVSAGAAAPSESVEAGKAAPRAFQAPVAAVTSVTALVTEERGAAPVTVEKSSSKGAALTPKVEKSVPVAAPAGTSAEETSVGKKKPVSSASASVLSSARDPVEGQRRLDEIRARYEADAPHKNFVTDHHTIVFGEGDPCARLMFVGEAPGEEEDKTGRPFVGRAGQLLDKMIVAMGLSRSSVYIANVLKTRPPNNATPTLEETRLCAPYLFEQIAVINPEVIVTLGLPATRALLGTMEAMGKLRGKWASFNPGAIAGGKAFAVMPTYHPAYILRNYTPQERAKVWSDLQMVMERLGLAKAGGGAGPA